MNVPENRLEQNRLASRLTTSKQTMISADSSTEPTIAENSTLPSSDSKNYEPEFYYTIFEVLVSLFAIVGNALVITVFWKERRLRRRTNYYIVSLATADLLVGLLGIPFALLASVGLPRNLHACLFTVSLLIVLCTISIFCLVAVSVDRYWAILHPMGYSRHVRTKTALVIISICWFAGCVIGFLPLMGWHQDVPTDAKCFFLEVMDYNYLVFLYIVTIITPALLLAAFYAHIYRVVLKQLRQIVTMNPENGTATTGRNHGGTMLRMLGAAQKREVKATQNLSIIVLFFMICWIPLYTINFILAFCGDCFEMNSKLMLCCIILSHLNSAGNPLLYAYHLRDFRAALKSFLCRVLRIGEPAVMTPGLNGRPSFGSNLAFQNHYGHQRLQSLRESRSAIALSTQSKYDSTLSLNSKYTSKSCSLPVPPKISSIVTQTASLAAAPTGDTAREIWRISEIPSISEEHSRDLENSCHECSKNRGNAGRQQSKRSASEGSGRVNSGYVVEPQAPHADLEEGDDDVFYDDFEPRNEHSSADSLDTNSDCGANATTPFGRLRANCLSSSSPQLNRGLFLVEAEMNRDREMMNPARSCNISDRGDGDGCDGDNGVAETLSGTFVQQGPVVKTLRRSPLKAVGEFLMNHGPLRRSKSTHKLNVNGDSSGITEQYSRKQNSIGVN